MDRIDTLIAARWLIPIEPAGRVLGMHSIAIHQGRIVAVLPTQQADQQFEADERCDRPTHVLLPGFVNAHTHAATALLRGAAQLSSAAALEQLGWSSLPTWLDAEYVRDGTELAIADMLAGGTTCFADVHLFPEVVAQSASAAMMRACIGLPILEAPTPWAASVNEYFERGLALRDDYRDDPFVTTALAPFAPNLLSDATLTRARRVADELELTVAVSVDKHSGRESETAFARLERLDLLSPLLRAVRTMHLEMPDIESAARTGINLVYYPPAQFDTRDGVGPLAELDARGANLALGSGPAASGALGMLETMRRAALLTSTLSPHTAEIPAHRWLHWATLGGARALGLGETIGSIEAGKSADLCCIDLANPRTEPVADPATSLVRDAGREQISDVWIAGRTVVRDRRLTRLDLQDILQRARRWGLRLANL
jgi:5-methylthioadenosine/S-adenosylhomocysteine deaminase